MRLIRDAHLSGDSIGNPLRTDGHDVRATDADAAFEEASDEFLLEVAIAEERILVSADTGDFRELLIRLAERGQQHFGVMLVPRSMRNNAFGAILRAIRYELSGTEPFDWVDRCIWLRNRDRFHNGEG